MFTISAQENINIYSSSLWSRRATVGAIPAVTVTSTNITCSIRTHAVKFCEAVVLCLSPKTVDSEIKDDDQSLDIVPDEEGFLKKRKLIENGKNVFKQLIEFVGSQSITRYLGHFIFSSQVLLVGRNILTGWALNRRN